MKTAPFYIWPALRNAGLRLLAATLAWAPVVAAEVPEWLRSAARDTLPAYAEKTDAVILLDEFETRVKEDGEVRTVRRLAYKILRPTGREHAIFSVAFDSETNLTFLKAWSICGGREEEVKEKEAVETGFTGETLYSDLRRKIITAPSSEVGAVVGYEYEQKVRPNIHQDIWWIQDPHPVRRGRYLLQLPKTWECRAVWIQYTPLEPRVTESNERLWEVQDVPAIEIEPSAPTWRAVGGRLALSYFDPTGTVGQRSWPDLGRWYTGLVAGVQEATPEIRQKVAELASQAPTLFDKIEAVSRFVQDEIRYVSIEIGIGGYRPHPASAVFLNRYGDCKDKVTLLNSMLKELGVKSYPVLVHSQRGAVAREFPSMLNFNHVILAIDFPGDMGRNFFSVQEHERLGRLLYFDPTSEFTPLGYLPAELQGGEGFLVTERDSELVTLKTSAPPANRLLRAAKMILTADGTLQGDIREVYLGLPAARWRESYFSTEGQARAHFVEDRFISAFVGARIENARAENLTDISKNLVLDFHVRSVSYAKQAGDLLLLRPRLMGWKGEVAWEQGKDRTLPFVFDMTARHSDIFDITLPSDYSVEELPAEVTMAFDFGEYASRAIVEHQVLHYTRTYTIKSLLVPPERFGELRRFFSAIVSDQLAIAVLKATPRQPPN